MIDISILKASEIARIINGELYGEDVEINKISIDSRENLDKNTCFWGIKGKKFDGNEFTLEAENKRAGLIVSNKRTIKGSHIYVRDTKIALELLAKSRIKDTKIKANSYLVLYGSDIANIKIPVPPNNVAITTPPPET